ncbi:hypothetical protein C8J57DRAFT_1251238 [Mycena rebaudengoi]|nr:hypothetical protein C8J57DRAFT_1251238 [Mycena rebaudengoi]
MCVRRGAQAECQLHAIEPANAIELDQFVVPCGKDPKDDECEYTDGPGRSRTKVLEDTVVRLESRLHESEDREDVMPSDMSTWNEFRDVEPLLSVWRLDYSTFSRVGHTITLHILRL